MAEKLPSRSMLVLVLSLLCSLWEAAQGCSDFIVTPGASKDSGTIVSYNADSADLYGYVQFYPRGFPKPGTMRKIYSWDTGEYLGEIPEASEVYNVVGNINEFGVAITESTFGGREELGTQPGAILDYGSLIWIALQRTQTAREAIDVMTTLVQTYGYASQGETFTIADSKEVWYMEMIGRGPGEKGAVWVALRVPDGFVSGHANQARIETFPLNDPARCVYSPDIVEFAKAKGFYPKQGNPESFSFTDAFDPLTFFDVRAGDARVWAMFRQVTGGMDAYLDYALGRNLSNRLPLWVRPIQQLSVADVAEIMRDHFKNSPLAFVSDVGAEAYQMPYRWRPLEWDYNGTTYFHERSIATQQTAFSLVAHLRAIPELPRQLNAVLWFGVDDSACAFRVPLYAGISEVPFSMGELSGDATRFSFQSAYWVTNMVCNLAYSRWSLIYREVRAKIRQVEHRLQARLSQVDSAAAALWKKDLPQAVALATDFSVKAGEETTAEILELWKTLFVKYMDGYMKVPSKNPQGFVAQTPGYSASWRSRIVAETGDRYRVPKDAPASRTLRGRVAVKGL
eukprot:RCo047307